MNGHSFGINMKQWCRGHELEVKTALEMCGVDKDELYYHPFSDNIEVIFVRNLGEPILSAYTVNKAGFLFISLAKLLSFLRSSAKALLQSAPGQNQELQEKKLLP